MSVPSYPPANPQPQKDDKPENAEKLKDKDTKQKKVLSFDDLRECGVACAKDGLVKCDIREPSCMCLSTSWLNIFSACFKNNCPIDEYRFTADRFKDICMAKEGGGSLTTPVASFIAELKLLANQSPANPTSTSTRTRTTTSTTTASTSTTPPPNSSSKTRTPPATPTNTPDIITTTSGPENTSKGLSTGGFVGIAIGAGFGTFALILLGWYLYRRRSRKNRSGDLYDNAEYFNKSREGNFGTNAAPYSAQYVGRYAPLIPQRAPPPVGIPPHIPDIVEAEDPVSISMMMHNKQHRN